VTAGVDLEQGSNVPKQHLLISSRTDGRGLKITTNSFLLIKGAYQVK